MFSARGLSDRTLYSVYAHARLLFDPLHTQNKGSEAEDDERLLQLVAEYPGQWRRIGLALGKSAQAVSNRYKILQRDSPTEPRAVSSQRKYSAEDERELRREHAETLSSKKRRRLFRSGGGVVGVLF